MTRRDQATVDALFADVDSARKAEILEAAMRVFSEQGYAAGSMREIASRVGVTEPALYRHFPSKEAIFLTLVHAIGTRLRSESMALIASVEPETFPEQLAAAFADRRRAVRLYAPMLRTVINAASRNPRILEEYRTSVVLPLREALTLKAAELDAAFGAPPHAEETRDGRVRALIALMVGYIVSSFVLADAPDEAIGDAAMRVMGWTSAG